MVKELMIRVRLKKKEYKGIFKIRMWGGESATNMFCPRCGLALDVETVLRLEEYKPVERLLNNLTSMLPVRKSKVISKRK